MALVCLRLRELGEVYKCFDLDKTLNPCKNYDCFFAGSYYI
jgi:hypothetical protein